MGDTRVIIALPAAGVGVRVTVTGHGREHDAASVAGRQAMPSTT